MKKAIININGVVQGVGFRPYILKLARKYNLAGYIENREYGVHMEVTGTGSSLRSFLNHLRHNPPPAAEIFDLDCVFKEADGSPSAALIIKASRREGAVSTFIPPDMSVCDACIKELSSENDRRYRYPFITCNDCGPRFSIIYGLPYDRPQTVMNEFPLCPECLAEYNDAECRRCHAQIISCPHDGPVLSFWEHGREAAPGNQAALQKALDRLKEGAVVAVKGIGGFHLACLAGSGQAVAALRRFKNRQTKPLALMARDLATIRRYARCSGQEISLLTSREKPIVILRKNDPCALNHIAPGIRTLGFMLPYSPLHFLLLQEFPLLVMTSGNMEGEVIIKDNDEAMEKLSPITPYFLLHNRKIINQCDDSILMAGKCGPVFLRRARGYVPSPVKIAPGKECGPVLATGADMKGCFALARNGFVWLSQFLGDLAEASNYHFFLENLRWFENAFDLKPQAVVSDLHPSYFSGEIGETYAKKHGLAHYRMQHHKAHIYSVMAEYDLRTAIGVAFDGTGYGEDGRIWGGEFFVLGRGGDERVAHLKYFPLLGGEKAVWELERLILGYLPRIFGAAWKTYYQPDDADKAALLVDLCSKGRNAVPTSSMGRLFDTVSALLGICRSPAYDGEAAVLLEAAAAGARTQEKYPWELVGSCTPWEIDVDGMIKKISTEHRCGRNIPRMARKFHNTISDIIATTALRIREKYRENNICLSGGVFQNRIILDQTVEKLSAQGFKTFINRKVPINDGGIALGQVYGFILRGGN
ncbi:MAG: carbamoyltransferase HypF [Bacillota bacterium]